MDQEDPALTDQDDLEDKVNTEEEGAARLGEARPDTGQALSSRVHVKV